jgi:two-component system NtrC family sensor kinase
MQALRSANTGLETRRLELLHSRNTLRALFDSVPISMYIVDAGYTLLAINKSRAGLAGAIPQQLVSRRCYEVLFQRDNPCPNCQVGETFAAGLGTRRIERRDLASGSMVEYEITSFPIHTESGNVSQVILFEDDVTEKRRLEVSLAQAEKLAAVGQLAAGVAHEINNPLTAVIANAQLLQRELDDAELKDMAALIQRAGERASGVVRELLDLSRQEPINLAAVDVNETLRRALSLVQPRLAVDGIQLSFAPQAELPPVLASQEQLQGVWLNLLINAMDTVQCEGGEIWVTSRWDEKQVFVTVSDNGQGIPPEHLGRIFEPFFTTKEPGHGTGLGLSISHRIIRQTGGDIRVESQLGVGTTFVVNLPVA